MNRQGSYTAILAPFSEAEPVFVLGAGRSGTSAVVGAMQVAGRPGYREGHLFPLLNAMAGALWLRYQGTPAAAESIDGMRILLLRAMICSGVEQVYGDSQSWFDKTPDHAMIRCIPLLSTLFPRARYIMMRRHPVPFAESRRRKFGEPVLSSLSEWVRSIESWRDNKHLLADEQHLELDSNQLRDEHTQERICAFLRLEHRQHKALKDYLVSKRPEATVHGDALLQAQRGLSDERKYNLSSILFEMLDGTQDFVEITGWSGETIQQAKAVLGSLPSEYGYALFLPENHLKSLVLKWAIQLEEYRHTAECHEKNAAYWAGEARAASEMDGKKG